MQKMPDFGNSRNWPRNLPDIDPHEAQSILSNVSPSTSTILAIWGGDHRAGSQQPRTTVTKRCY